MLSCAINCYIRVSSANAGCAGQAICVSMDRTESDFKFKSCCRCKSVLQAGVRARSWRTTPQKELQSAIMYVDSDMLMAVDTCPFCYIISQCGACLKMDLTVCDNLASIECLPTPRSEARHTYQVLMPSWEVPTDTWHYQSKPDH